MSDKFYLIIDGVDAETFGGVLELDDYSYLIDQIFDLSDGSRDSTTFDNIEVSLALNALLAPVLSLAATGQVIPQIRIVGTSGADEVVTSELILRDVIITDVSGGDGDLDTFKFDYRQIALRTWEIDAFGNRTEGTEFARDIVDGVALDIAAFDTDTPDTLAGLDRIGGPVPDAEYFLIVDGLFGPSQQDGFEGAFELAAFEFGLDLTTRAPDFSDLQVQAELGLAAPAFAQIIADGGILRGVKVVGVNYDSAGAPQVVYDLRLANVKITEFVASSDPLQQLAFEYENISLETRTFTDSGETDETYDFGWDIPDGTTGGILPDVDPGAPRDTSFGTLSYYLVINELSGTSQRVGAEGAFELIDFVQQTEVVRDLTSAEKTVAQPLELRIDGRDLDAYLAEAALRGVVIDRINIIGLDADGEIRSDQRFESLTVAGLSLDDSGRTSFAMSYAATTWELTGFGGASRDDAPTEFYGFSFVDNVPLSDPLVAAKAGAPAVVTAIEPDKYTLFVSYGEDATGKEIVRAYELENFSIGFDQDPNSTRGSGEIVAGPLDVSMMSTGDIADLLSAAARGLVIDKLQIVGSTSTSAAGLVTTYDLRLKDVLIALAEDNGEEQAFSFYYNEIGLTTKGLDERLQLSTVDEFAFSLVDGVPLPGVAAVDQSVAESATPLDGLRYYLLIDGLDGESTRAGVEGAFALDDFGISVFRDDDISGGRSSTAEFSDLQVNLAADAELPAFVQLAATLRIIPNVQLVGLADDGTVQYDLRLGQVSLNSIDETGGGDDALKFSYGQIDLATFVETIAGETALGTSFAYNVASGVSLTPELAEPLAPRAIGPTTPGTTAGAVPDPEKFFLYIDGINGNSTDENAQGAFDLGEFLFPISSVPVDDGSGTSRGKVEFGEVELRFDSGADLGDLLRIITTGAVIPAVRIVGEAPVGGTPTVVYDLRFGKVGLSEIEDYPDAESVKLVFEQIEIIASRFDPQTGASRGTDSFGWNVATGTAGVSVPLPVIPPANTDPVAKEDVANTDEDTSVKIDALANDTDSDGDPLTAVLLTQASEGVVLQNSDGTFTYTPDLNFNGVDSFKYGVSDGKGGTDEATVTVTVNPVNDLPVALNDTAAVMEDDDPTQILVLANDFDVDGDPLTIIAASADKGGTVTNAGTSLTYTPAANFNGVELISYTISDGQGGESSATVKVTVAAVNDRPDINADTARVDEDSSVIIDVLANDSDVDGDTLTLQSVSKPANGLATINADGTITYTPDANFNGVDNFKYGVSDGNGGVSAASVSVTVDPVNDPATIGGQLSGSVVEDRVLEYTGQLTISDIDGAQEEAFAEGTFAGSFGAVTIFADGLWVYTLNNSSPAVQALDDGERLADAVKVFSVDGTEQVLEFEIGGTDDQGRGDPVADGTDRDDTIDADTLAKGGRFSDIVNAGAGDDTVASGNGGDVVFAGLGDDVVDGGNGDDLIFGGLGNDTLSAGVGDDEVNGGLGDDLISGGKGIDQLTGDGGVDTFVFNAMSELDTVTDFEIGQDMIRLDGVLPGQLSITDSPDGVILSYEKGTMLLLGVTAAELASVDPYDLV